jgi:Flp pilus assembly protein TadG
MPSASRKGILLTIRRLVRDNRALSAVEFALILPVMLTLFLGGTEITQGITIKRKTTIATRTIADLVAQGTNIDNAEMASIFAATGAVLSPYPAANLKMVISNIAIDANNNASIVWSDGYNGGVARTVGSSVTLPAGLDAYPNTSLIWAEAEYTYTPTIGYVVTGSLGLKDKVYLRSRLTACVRRETGGQTIKCPWES